MLVVLAACATPPIRLSPVWRVGDAREYTLSVDATTTIEDPQGAPITDTTVLRARATLEVVAVEGEEATVQMTLNAERYAVNGVARALDPQEVELIVGADGEVLRVASVGGLPAELVQDVGDLAPLLGAPLPTDRLRLGERWRRQTPTSTLAGPGGEQTGRVSALRIEHGYDCAIVALGTRRPVVRERSLGDQSLALVGTEFSTSEVAFAFREGFFVRISTTSEGRFTVQGFGSSAGRVLIETTSVLELANDQAS